MTLSNRPNSPPGRQAGNFKLFRAPLDIYKTLLKHFGPQGWWPIAEGSRVQGVGYRVKKEIKLKYHPGKKTKLTQKQAFEIAVGAILTQNTAWKNVEKAIVELNNKNLMDPKKIITTKLSALQAYIRSSGYFKQKAKKLKILAHYWLQKRIGQNFSDGPLTLPSPSRGEGLGEGDFIHLRQELLNLWGIGPETADSILLYALNKPVFVVDAYTRRVGERLGWKLPKDYEGIRSFFERQLPVSVDIYQEFHALFVQLAKENCAKRNPLCPTCPLTSQCFYAKRNTRELSKTA